MFPMTNLQHHLSDLLATYGGHLRDVNYAGAAKPSSSMKSEMQLTRNTCLEQGQRISELERSRVSDDNLGDEHAGFIN